MQSHARRLGVIAMGLALFWACVDASDEGPSLEELPEVLVQAICPELEACLGEETAQRYFGDGGCAERFGAQLEDGDFEATQEAVAAGRVRYDASKVDACVAQLQGVGCGFESMRVLNGGACGEVLEGDVEVGGECALDEDCEGDAFCDRSGGACPGTCTVLLGAGEPCESDDQCDDGFTCPERTRRCSTPGGKGAACGGNAGAVVCAAGLACVGEDQATGRAGVCRDPDELFVVELGATCDLDSGALCEKELACVLLGVSGATPEFRCAERVESGAACRFAVPSQCPEGEHCADLDPATGDFDGTCAPLPVAGEACSAAGGAQCADGLLCETDGLCHPVNRLGQPCVSDRGCASGQCRGGECVRPESCALRSEDAG